MELAAFLKSYIDHPTTFTGPTALKFVFDGVKVSGKDQCGQTFPQFQAISGLRQM